MAASDYPDQGRAPQTGGTCRWDVASGPRIRRTRVVLKSAHGLPDPNAVDASSCCATIVDDPSRRFPTDRLMMLDESYPNTEVVRLVVDNLNTYHARVLYEDSPPSTPGGWLGRSSGITPPSTAAG